MLDEDDEDGLFESELRDAEDERVANGSTESADAFSDFSVCSLPSSTRIATFGENGTNSGCKNQNIPIEVVVTPHIVEPFKTNSGRPNE